MEACVWHHKNLKCWDYQNSIMNLLKTSHFCIIYPTQSKKVYFKKANNTSKSVCLISFAYYCFNK